MGPKRNVPQDRPAREDREQTARDWHKWIQTVAVIIGTLSVVVGMVAMVAKVWNYTIDEAKERTRLENRVTNIESNQKYILDVKEGLLLNEWNQQQAEQADLEERARRSKAGARMRQYLQGVKPPPLRPRAQSLPLEAGERPPPYN